MLRSFVRIVAVSDPPRRRFLAILAVSSQLESVGFFHSRFATIALIRLADRSLVGHTICSSVAPTMTFRY